MRKDNVWLVIPAYNEEANIKTVVEQWYPVVEKIGLDSRILVVNDGSKDRTQKKLLELQKKYPQLLVEEKVNGGHGAAIHYGYDFALRAGAEYIFQTDSDGQTLPSEFWQLWMKRRNCGLLIGHRSSRQDGWQRVVVTKVLKLVLRITFGVWVTDANTPFRLMHRDQLLEILKEIPDGHNLTNVLMSVLYTKKGYKVIYFPITFRPRQGGKNSINMKKIFKIGAKAFVDFKELGKTFRKYGKGKRR